MGGTTNLKMPLIMSVFFIAMVCATAMGRIIEFEGRQWIVKSSEDDLIGPGPNYFSDSNESVWVDDANALHLKIRREGPKWYCAEVYTQLPTVHGKHRFYVDDREGRLGQLDPNVVVGLFLYKSDDEEIDIEFAEWGIEDGYNAWYVVQRPGVRPPPDENKKGFDITLNGDYSTHYIDWQSSFINFKSFHGHYEEPPTPDYLIDEWIYSGSDNPPESSNLKIHMNLWLHDPCEVQGLPPSDGQEVEIVIKRADFPAAGQPKYGGGTGEPNNPYLIYTAAHMNAIGADSNDWDRHFKLMTDIHLSSYTGDSFNIIGNSATKFTGVFDGNGHTILNFTYDSNNINHIGLFGYVRWPAELKDLGLINPNVDSGTGNDVGSLVGYVGYGTITNCYVEGGSISGDFYVGGLVGNNYRGTITNCYSESIVSVSSAEGYGAGGLVGDNLGTITNCYAKDANVTGHEGVGGLVGWNEEDGTISNCYSTGSVSGFADVGGLVGGNATSGGLGTITTCYSTGSVSGIVAVGGLVGYNDYGIISNCYSTGSVTGTTNVGGLIGYDTGGPFTKSFWDNTVNSSITGIGNTSDANVIAESTTNMQIENTFTDAGWDFVGESTNGTQDIWRLCNEGVEYPQLNWQFPLGDFVCPDGVDWSDLAVFCEQWLQVGAYSADIASPPAGDGIVNFLDFAALVQNWLAGF